MAEYRSVGMTYGIKNVLALLFENKFPMKEIKSYIEDETVLNTLKNINTDKSLNISMIKAIFILYRRKSTLKGTLKTYYDFILTEGTTMVNSLHKDIIEADAAGQWTEFIDTLNMLMYRAKSSTSALEPAIATETERAAPPAPAPLPAPTMALASASSNSSTLPAPEPEPSTTVSNTTNLTLTSVLPSNATKKYSLKVSKAPSVASGTSTSAATLLKGGLTVGYKIHIKDDSLNNDKHKESMLNDINNTHAKLLVIDIESCTDVIYPVAIDLAPESTNKDILDYIVKVLTEATQKNLKCHASFHVFTVRALTDSSRVIYISVGVAK